MIRCGKRFTQRLNGLEALQPTCIEVSNLITRRACRISVAGVQPQTLRFANSPDLGVVMEVWWGDPVPEITYASAWRCVAGLSRSCQPTVAMCWLAVAARELAGPDAHLSPCVAPTSPRPSSWPLPWATPSDSAAGFPPHELSGAIVAAQSHSPAWPQVWCSQAP